MHNDSTDSRALDEAADTYFICRSSKTDDYSLWRFDPAHDELMVRVETCHGAKFDRTHHIASIGDYLLEWGPLAFKDYTPSYPYRLFQLDPASRDPLGAAAVQKGLWPKSKFFGSRPDFGNPSGASKIYQSGDELMLVPLHHVVLNLIPTAGRGSFGLWNFDPNPLAHGKSDPLPVAYSNQGSYSAGAFNDIQDGHELIPMGNYVLDRVTRTGEYRVWSVDAQSPMPLAEPAIQSGRWRSIDEHHRLVPLGELLLDWVPATREYRLWRFDPTLSDPLCGPLKTGVLPADLDGDMSLVSAQPLLPINAERARQPGTIEFMRTRIKHVVYLMLENRSFDHICGWLYEHGEQGVHFVGSDRPFDGASLAYSNLDGDTPVHLSKFQDGRLSEDWVLDFLQEDPYHNNSDVLRQMFSADQKGYARRAVPDMGGFIWNNGTREVMQTYTPHQVPVLNGLARGFAISDEWFCSMVGGTDVNRAFSLSGSAMGYLDNFQNGAQYEYWPQASHRPSIFKALWSNGVTDWKIYHSVEWMDFVFTYHLFLDGQIPSVDADPKKFISGIHQFKSDARAGKLPKFSFLEPVWIAPAGTTSYHPGGDLVAGEIALNEIYEAIKSGPGWDQTLLVLTFDEHGGIFDHVAPPYAANPWPNDQNNGYRYDLLGPRVPTILVSPWIKEQTVFRARGGAPYDSTSILATLLRWCGVPRSRWGLGDRTHHAPTFEGTLLSPEARTDAPSLTPPYDKNYPRSGEPPANAQPLHDLHRTMTPRLIWALARGRLTPAETQRISAEILSKATDLPSLHAAITEAAARLR